MTEGLAAFANFAALLLEGGAALLILIGAIGSFARIVMAVAMPKGRMGAELRVWTRFGIWLMLGLEFELGADVIRSAISPTWNAIGQLAAIAVIRTFLNYFIERDVDKGAAVSPG